MYGKGYYDWTQERECELKIKREIAKILDDYDPEIRARVLAKMRAKQQAENTIQHPAVFNRPLEQQQLMRQAQMARPGSIFNPFGGLLP